MDKLNIDTNFDEGEIINDETKYKYLIEPVGCGKFADDEYCNISDSTCANFNCLPIKSTFHL